MACSDTVGGEKWRCVICTDAAAEGIGRMEKGLSQSSPISVKPSAYNIFLRSSDDVIKAYIFIRGNSDLRNYLFVNKRFKVFFFNTNKNNSFYFKLVK